MRRSLARGRRWWWAGVVAAVMLLHPTAELRSAELVEPVRGTGTLEIRAIEGAQVEIDGHRRGEVPVSVDLPEGEHRVKVVAPGHHPWHATLEVRAGANIAVVTELVRLGAAESPVVPPRAETPRPAASDVFLATKQKSVFMAAKRLPARADALLPATSLRSGADPFMAAKRHQSEAPVFLATDKKSVFLTPKAARSPDALLPSRPATGADVFMPVRRPSSPERPEP